MAVFFFLKVSIKLTSSLIYHKFYGKKNLMKINQKTCKLKFQSRFYIFIGEREREIFTLYQWNTRETFSLVSTKECIKITNRNSIQCHGCEHVVEDFDCLNIIHIINRNVKWKKEEKNINFSAIPSDITTLILESGKVDIQTHR